MCKLDVHESVHLDKTMEMTTQVAVGTSRQQIARTLPDAVNTVKCS